MRLVLDLARAKTHTVFSCICTSPSAFRNTIIKMNRDTDIEALDTSLKETQDLIDIIHRKYKSFPDVEHSKSVAALVHLVGKELGMIVKERKLTLELNQTLREKIQDLETETNNRRLATERADAQSKEAKLAEKRAEDAKKRFEEDASRVVVGDEVQKKVCLATPSH